MKNKEKREESLNEQKKTHHLDGALKSWDCLVAAAFHLGDASFLWLHSNNRLFSPTDLWQVLSSHVLAWWSPKYASFGTECSQILLGPDALRGLVISGSFPRFHTQHGCSTPAQKIPKKREESHSGKAHCRESQTYRCWESEATRDLLSVKIILCIVGL